MKGMLATLAAVAFTGSAALADAPAKTMDTSAGRVWVNDQGMTLYVFNKDAMNTSNCYDQCATNWPPFIAAAGATSTGAWTIIDRKDGTKMWAYDGRPLYTFVKDKKAGDVTGDGVGGVWYVAVEEAWREGNDPMIQQWPAKWQLAAVMVAGRIGYGTRYPG